MNKFIWCLNRLRCMSTKEIIYRIKQEITNKTEFIRSNLNTENFIYTFISNKKIKNYVEKFISLDIDENYIIEYANKILCNEMNILGEIYKFNELKWRFDIKANIESNLVYWTKINYRDKSVVGNIKNVWELNRLQHLLVLAIAYRKTLDNRYLDKYIENVLSWIEQNPYGFGVNWTCSLECSLRNITLIYSYYLLIDYITEEQIRFKIEQLIALNGQYIFKHLSLYSSANNHLLGELLGLYFTSMTLDEPLCKTWGKKAYNMFCCEIIKQNYNDGVNREQAIYYHAYIADYLTIFIKLNELDNIHIDKRYYYILEKMIDFLDDILDCNENAPNIGDMDGGYCIKIDDMNQMKYYKSIITTGAFILKKRYSNMESKIDNRSMLLLANDYMYLNEKHFNCYLAKSDKIYSDGGYCILRDNSSQIIFDFGHIGYLSIAAHGHSDCLNLLLNKNGKPFLIDCGTYSYDYDEEKRYYFKSSQAHNVVTFNDHDQATYGGSFIWLKKPKAKLIYYDFGEPKSVIIAEHDGYKNLKISHIRTIYHKKNEYLLIIDSIDSKNKVNAKWFFHLNKECQVNVCDGLIYVRNGDEEISIYSVIIDGENILNENLKQCTGWESYNIGEIHQAITLTLEKNIQNKLIGAFIFNLDNNKRKIFIESNNIAVQNTITGSIEKIILKEKL